MTLIVEGDNLRDYYEGLTELGYGKHDSLVLASREVLENNGFEVKREVQVPVGVPYGQQRKYIGNKICEDYPESGKEKLSLHYFNSKWEGSEVRVDVCAWKEDKNIVGVEVSVGHDLKKDVRNLRKIPFRKKIILTEDIQGEIEGGDSGTLEGGPSRKIKIVDVDGFEKRLNLKRSDGDIQPRV